MAGNTAGSGIQTGDADAAGIWNFVLPCFSYRPRRNKPMLYCWFLGIH